MDTDIDTTTALDMARDAGRDVELTLVSRVVRVAPQPPAQVERCDNCRFWKRSGWYKEDDARAMGECNMFDYPTRVELLGDYYGGRPEFNTPADWHCAGWTQKETKP